MADWSELPEELLMLVTERLASLVVYLRFGAVCTSWRSASSKGRPRSRLPYLIVPVEGEEEEVGLFDLSDQKVYYGLKFPKESRHWRCFGSSHSWLAMTDLDTGVRLLNPMSGAQVELPPVRTFPEIIDVLDWPTPEGRDIGEQEEDSGGSGGVGGSRRGLLYVMDWDEEENKPFGWDAEELLDFYTRKVCLSSSDPASDPECVTMVIYSDMCRLAYARPGDETWTALDTRWSPYDDIVYHAGKFYALSHSGAVVVVEVDVANSGSHNVTKIASKLRPIRCGMKYLVPLPSGELALVIREVKYNGLEPYQTVDFEVLKMDTSCNSAPKWATVESLDDCALFLGHSCSMSFSPSEVLGGCRKNHIYFTDDYLEGYYSSEYGGHDMGIFNLEDGSIKPYYPIQSQLIMPPPMWIMPNPW